MTIIYNSVFDIKYIHGLSGQKGLNMKQVLFTELGKIRSGQVLHQYDREAIAPKKGEMGFDFCSTFLHLREPCVSKPTLRQNSVWLSAGQVSQQSADLNGVRAILDLY